jgi:hypothetical protein
LNEAHQQGCLATVTRTDQHKFEKGVWLFAIDQTRAGHSRLLARMLTFSELHTCLVFIYSPSDRFSLLGGAHKGGAITNTGTLKLVHLSTSQVEWDRCSEI